MNKTILAGFIAFAAFVTTLSNASSADDGFKDGVTGVTITNKLIGADKTVHMLVKKSKLKNGDGVFWIQKEKNSKEWLTVDGNKVDFAQKKPVEWILHKNSTGWSIMLKSNAALAVSLNKNKNGLELQRNQGAPHQVWQIAE